MGQKIHPYGFRVGISKPWRSTWFAEKDSYADLALEDHKIRGFLEERLSIAGLKDVAIKRAVKELDITLRVSRPGLVIGRGGSGIQQLEADLKKITDAKIKLTVEEIKNPELEAKLVADYIDRQMRRRMAYRRVIKSAIRSAMDKGAKGIKVRVSGVLSGGNTIARSEIYSEGSIPTQTLRADIDYAQHDCKRLFGVIGIKVWIYKGGDLRMLLPKRVKYRSTMRGRNKGIASRGAFVNFGEFGLKSLEAGYISSRQIEAARKAITHRTKRTGKVWIRIFPDKPIPKKPNETRMGGGKSPTDHYAAVVKPGTILFELAGISKDLAKAALKRASDKLSVKTKIVSSDIFGKK